MRSLPLASQCSSNGASAGMAAAGGVGARVKAVAAGAESVRVRKRGAWPHRSGANPRRLGPVIHAEDGFLRPGAAREVDRKEQDRVMTRNAMKILGALAIVGTVAVGTATPSVAQGFYFSGPGFSFGVGTPYYYGYRYYYGGPYAYYYPYHRHWWWHHHHHWRH
jgi:hypothetical protein